MGGHRAPGERDLAGRSWHRRGGRRGRSGRMRPPSSRARGSECRSQMTRGRRDGDTPRATRGRERRRTRRPGARRHGGYCGGDERDRGDGPPTPDPAGQEHVPLSRSTRSGAWQPRTGNASKVHGYSKVRTKCLSDPTERWSGPLRETFVGTEAPTGSDSGSVDGQRRNPSSGDRRRDGESWVIVRVRRLRRTRSCRRRQTHRE